MQFARPGRTWSFDINGAFLHCKLDVFARLPPNIGPLSNQLVCVLGGWPLWPQTGPGPEAAEDAHQLVGQRADVGRQSGKDWDGGVKLAVQKCAIYIK